MATKWDGKASQYNGPTLADCQRAWDYLTTEYVTDLEVHIILQKAMDPDMGPVLVCISPGFDNETGGPRTHIWATKMLQHAFEAVTYRQLYDLLMNAHRSIEHALSGQEPMPLP